jgi:hypothetical protein
MDNPKPCPFCGGIPEIHKHFCDDMCRLLHRCPVIGPIMFEWDEKMNLIRRWNIRKEESCNID